MVALQAGSVKVQNLNQTSDAVAAIGGNVVLTSLDANGTGVQVYSNAPASDNLNAQVPTIYAGQKGGVTIQAQNSPIEVLNQAGGQVITTSGESSVAINPSQMATGVRVNGNVTNDDKSSVGIYETGTGSYLKADKITTTASSSTYVVLHGDAAYTSLSGGTSEIISIFTLPLYTAAVFSATSFIRRTRSSRSFVLFVRIVP
jgi:autotransporter family porin